MRSKCVSAGVPAGQFAGPFVGLVIVKGGSHGALSEAINESRAFRDAVFGFARSGDLSGVPAEVNLSSVDWAVPGLNK